MSIAGGEVPQVAGATTRWQVLIGAIIVQLILGTVYGYSIFWKPLDETIYPPVLTQAEADVLAAAGQDTSDALIVGDAEAARVQGDVQRGRLKYAFSICILSFAVLMVVAGRVQDLKGPRFTAIIGAVLMGCGFLIAGAAFSSHAFTGSGAWSQLLLLWCTVGFLAGAGIGFAYVCPIAALIKWFPQNKGLVSGLAVAGFGFGAYLFKGESQLGALGFIRAHSIETFFLVHGVVCLVAIVIGAMLLRNPPGPQPMAATDSRWQDTLQRPAFYVLWLMFFSGAMAGLMVIGIVKDFAGEQLVGAAGAGIDAAAKESLLLKGAAAVGWLAIFNAVGRIAWGFVSDRIGRTAAFAAMFAFQAIMMFVLVRMHTELSLAVAASIVGFNFGGNFALFPSATADLFGARNLGANYGWVFTSYGIAGVVGIAAGNAAKTMTGSYAAAFGVAGGLCLLSAALAIALHLSRKRAPAAAVAAA
jgi:OFA family oxalate/formate antiporter-like MFS transporter